MLCDLRTSRGITVEKLRGADAAIRCHIYPPERLQVLDEIYRVREEEEKFLNGQQGFSLHSLIGIYKMLTCDRLPSGLSSSCVSDTPSLKSIGTVWYGDNRTQQFGSR
jgi:hypothetical protein